jgi:hypothetical protein
MLVEFTRAVRAERHAAFGEYEPTTGEDDGLSNPPPVTEEEKIKVNPVYVAAVMNSQRHQGVTIIRFSDGRGYLVKGSYQETVDRLEAAGHLDQDD